MNPEQALEQVVTFIKGQFPQEAVDYISAHKELFEDRLIHILETYAEDPELYDLWKDDYISALYLLAQFQSQKAFPILIRFLKTLPYSLEKDQPLGDCITEEVPYILAACFDGDFQKTYELIYSQESYLYARLAVLRMAEICLCMDKIDEKQALAFFEEVIDGIFDKNKEDEFLEMCLDNLAEISLNKVDEIVARKGIILDEMVQFEIDYFRREKTPKPYYLWNKATTQRKYKDLIQNGMEEIKGWMVFKNTNENSYNNEDDNNGSWVRSSSWGTVRNDHNLGRNDPCFCGNGKKFKKCCLQ